jgi:methylmalonyl-CoA/ethylmalonyl-CoA epimerase
MMNAESAEKSPLANLIQIGVVVKDLEQAMERFKALGVGPFYNKTPPPNSKTLYRGQPMVSAERVKIMAAMLGNCELELVQPLQGASPHREYLEAKGEGIQHLGFLVDDLEKSTEKLKAGGSSIVMTGRRPDGSGVTYLDLEVAGVIVELIKH